MAKLNITQEEYRQIEIIMALAGACASTERINEQRYYAGMADVLGEETAMRLYAFTELEIVIYPSVEDMPRHGEHREFVRRLEYGNSI